MGGHQMSANLNSVKSGDNQDFSIMNEIYEWIEAIVFAFVFVIILFTFVFRVVGVEGISMKNTLNREVSDETVTLDRVIITHLNYTPKQGDIIVLAHKSSISDISVPYIKRIIALAGQTVNIKNNSVFVDGIKIKENYKYSEIIGKTKAMGDVGFSGDVKFPVKVPANCVFVMGDNRENSQDSRFSKNTEGVGMLDVRNILGKAIFRIFPFNQIGAL
jgi:signal peptidase I